MAAYQGEVMNNRRNLVIAFGASALSVMVLLGYLIWSGYRESIHAAESQMRNFASIIETRLDATLRRTVAALWQLVQTIPVMALNADAASRYVRGVESGLNLQMTNFAELTAYELPMPMVK